MRAVRAVFPDAVTVTDYVAATRTLLEPYGFSADATLPMVGVCRDELMFPFEDAVSEAWGPAFDLSSLGGMLLLGRTGLSAALAHAPDGRHRYLAIAMPHVGLDDDGTVGRVLRPGQSRPTAACGALKAFGAELAEGRLDVVLDPLDLEQSLLKHRMLRGLRYGDSPDLLTLTRVAQQVILEDLLTAARTVVAPGGAGGTGARMAVFSGIVVHGPDGVDAVAPGPAYLLAEGDTDGVPLAVPAG